MLAGLGCALTPLAACVADKQPASANAVDSPIVWSGMTQAELDKAYNQSAYAPNESQLIARYRDRSNDALTRLGRPQRASYGATPIEGMDINGPMRRTRRFTFSFTGVHGASPMRETMGFSPRYSSVRASISWCSISRECRT